MLTTKVIFDSASDHFYATSGLVQTCRPLRTGQEFLSYSAIGGKCDSWYKLRSVYNLELLDPQGQAHSLSAVEVSSICGPIERSSVPQYILKELHHLSLADEYNN